MGSSEKYEDKFLYKYLKSLPAGSFLTSILVLDTNAETVVTYLPVSVWESFETVVDDDLLSCSPKSSKEMRDLVSPKFRARELKMCRKNPLPTYCYS